VVWCVVPPGRHLGWQGRAGMCRCVATVWKARGVGQGLGQVRVHPRYGTRGAGGHGSPKGAGGSVAQVGPRHEQGRTK